MTIDKKPEITNVNQPKENRKKALELFNEARKAFAEKKD